MPLKYVSIGLAILLAGCQGGAEWRKAPMTLAQPGSTVQVRVVHATNPRLARMSPEQLRIMLASARRTVKQNFDVDVVFTDVAETDLSRLFRLIPPALREARKSAIYDFKSGSGDRRRLAEGINTTLTQRGTRLEDGLAYVRPYLPDAHAPDIKSFSELLAGVMLERLDSWRSVKAADGAPLLDAAPYNEMVYWDTLGYGDLQYELVITNQLFASAEYVGVDIHTAIRGGVTVGLTSFSRRSRFGTYIAWSTFPFQDNSENTLRLRGGERYSDEEAAGLAGAYLAHEIGHMLFMFGHPFGQKSCVMNPVSMLRFREWRRQIDGAACPIGSRPEMTAGAITEYYNANWLRMATVPEQTQGPQTK